MDKKYILPFHLFAYNNSHYIINIEKMQASPVDETTCQILKKVEAGPEGSFPVEAEEILEKLGLISELNYNKKNINKDEFFPITMTLLLTQSCNLKCIYCYGGYGEYGTGGSMEEETAFRAVDWLIEQSGKIEKLFIEFLGGEPFLKFPLMKAVVAYAKKSALKAGKEIKFRVITNGTLLEEEQIAFLKENNIFTTISFDGPREVQDAQRPYANAKGSYDSTIPKIEKLLAVMPEAHGHAVITGNNNSKHIKDVLQEIGFKQVTATLVSRSFFADKSQEEKFVRAKESFLNELEQEADDWIYLTKSRDSEALLKLKGRYGLYDALVSLLHNSKKHFFCGAGRKLVGISASGDIYLCHRFVGMEEYKLGNIYNKRLDREKFLYSPTASNEICSACFARYHCGGGCKHDNLGSSGSISVPAEDMCHLKRWELELAAIIVCRLDSEDMAFLVENQIFTQKTCPLDF